jgi:hypothetical protein
MIWTQLYVEFCVALAAFACIIIAIATAGRERDASSPAEQKALTLLRAWLSPEQAQQYDSRKHFEVIGSDTGTRYRIRHGNAMNVDQLDAAGNKVCGWCFVPEGELAAGDCSWRRRSRWRRSKAGFWILPTEVKGMFGADLAPANCPRRGSAVERPTPVSAHRH